MHRLENNILNSTVHTLRRILFGRRLPDHQFNSNTAYQPILQNKICRFSSTKSNDDRATAFVSDKQHIFFNENKCNRLSHRVLDDRSKDWNIILFPGARNVYPGAGTDLLCIKEAEQIFKKANDILKFDLLSLCLGGPKEELNNLENRHLAAFVISHASLAKLEHDIPKSTDWVSGVVGEDVGMFNALVFAQCLSFEKALQLVRLRAQALVRASEIVPSAQIRLHLKPATQKHKISLAAKRHCLGLGIPEDIAICSITRYLGPSKIEMGGHKEAISYLTKEGARLFEFKDFKLLPNIPAYNTQLMKPVEKFLYNLLNGDSIIGEDDLILPKKCAVYSILDGVKYKNIDRLRRDLSSHVCMPIRLEQTLHGIFKRDRRVTQPNTYVMWDHQLMQCLKRVNDRAARSAKLIKA